VTIGDVTRRLFVSPHLDDAVFACGQWIASSSHATVVTIFAASAPHGAAPTPWDRECGFDAGDDVVALRRNEDRAALDILAARAVWLDFHDDQYGEVRTKQDIAEALRRIAERAAPAAIHCPLGLFHADHRRASDASLALFDHFRSLAWHVYDDAIYRRIAGAADARRRELAGAGFALARVSPVMARDADVRKRHAVACYRSQLRALRTRNAHDDVFAAEAHWVLSRHGDPA